MTSSARVRRLLAAAAAVVLLAAGCTDDAGSPDTSPPAVSRPQVDTDEATVAGGFDVRPGVEVATVTGAEAGHDLTLVDDSGAKLITLVSDEEGQAHFAYVPDEYLTYETGEGGTLPTAAGQQLDPGTYTVRDESADPVAVSEPFEVLARDDVPDEAFFAEQEVGEGFGYVTARDGVQLSVNVVLPGPIEDGPYPTVIEYSGYGPSNPAATEPGSLIAQLVGGYATVGVNMRGTGCSGGVFDVFNPAQQADGYDVVEAIAHQPWVKGNKVGMVGLSYSGITQLYVASTQPPSLAAIAPLSVIGDSWQMAWPGGIYNTGFTQQWLAERNRQSEAGGSDWVQARVDEGDTTCEDNQRIRTQNPDFGEFTRSLEDRPVDADSRDLELLVSDIEVPVLLSGAFQDEQTGPRFGAMLDDFTGTDDEHFILFNGRHPDGYSTLVLSRWVEFLSLYVKDEVPEIPQTIRDAAPAFLGSNFGVEGLEFEPDRFTDIDDVDAARELFAADPTVRVLFESGTGDPAQPGSPTALFEADFPAWPPPEATPTTFFFGEDGTLASEAPGGDAADVFTVDPAAGEDTFFADDSGDYPLLDPIWETDWQPWGDGQSASYVTEPFAEDTVVAGAGYADLWVQTSAEDADVQVTVTVVQPDGTEFWVQSGQLRLSHRALDGEVSDDLEVDHYFDEEHRQPMAVDEWEPVQVAIPHFAQAFRAGSRLRVVVSSPGHDRALWRFATTGADGDRVTVGRGGDHASSVVLALVDGVDVPANEIACPSLRGQACRPYAATVNTPA